VKLGRKSEELNTFLSPAPGQTKTPSSNARHFERKCRITLGVSEGESRKDRRQGEILVGGRLGTVGAGVEKREEVAYALPAQPSLRHRKFIAARGETMRHCKVKCRERQGPKAEILT
jgi:hypothetical protein